MCSLSNLASLKPTDIVTKLRTLLLIVVLLFAGCNLGAVLGLALDRRERRRVLARLRTPECGYCTAADGCGLWSFSLDPLVDELAAPSGSAVAMCTVFGMPFARLRASLPDEWFADDDAKPSGGSAVAAALGRRHGFSRAGMTSALQLQAELLRAGGGSSSRERRPTAAPAAAADEDTSMAAAAGAAVDFGPVAAGPGSSTTLSLQYFVGTALVLAFLQVTQLTSVTQLAAHCASAVRHFEGVTTPAGWSFADTQVKFLTLLSPGVLNARRNWWLTARLWRLILSQSPDGGWPCSATVAFALQARALREVEGLEPSCWARLKEKVGGYLEMGAEAASAEEITDVLDMAEFEAGREGADGDVDAQARGKQRGTLLLQSSDSQNSAGAGSGATGGSPMHRMRSARLFGAQHDDGTALDDPLAYSERSILEAMPRRLAALAAAAAAKDAEEGDADALLEDLVPRVWATLCCIAAAERFTISWLWVRKRVCTCARARITPVRHS
jgi:hypothetical protein